MRLARRGSRQESASMSLSSVLHIDIGSAARGKRRLAAKVRAAAKESKADQ